MTTTDDILILQCCECGAKLEVEQDDGDCEDDEGPRQEGMFRARLRRGRVGCHQGLSGTGSLLAAADGV